MVRSDVFEGVWVLFCFFGKFFLIWKFSGFDDVWCCVVNDCWVSLILFSFWISVEVLILCEVDEVFWNDVFLNNVVGFGVWCIFEWDWIVVFCFERVLCFVCVFLK